MKTPELVSDELTLKPFSKAFVTHEYLSWLSDEHVVAFSENRHRLHTVESCMEYFQAMVQGGHFFWAILLRGRHIGNLTGYVDRPNGLCELAIMIGDGAARGQGCGARAWGLAMDWLLGDGGLRKVHAGTMRSNKAMYGVFVKTGMTIEGYRPAHFLLNGKPEDLIYAGKLSEGQS